jgi:SET domain-containing protein
MLYYLKTSPEMGRGLYAMYDLQAGKILFTAELLVLSESDTHLVNKTDLQYYTFKYSETQDCLVLGDGEIFNHDTDPNIGYKLIDFDGRKVMMFYTLKNITQNDQLMIDYGADVNVDTSKYVINLDGGQK